MALKTKDEWVLLTILFIVIGALFLYNKIDVFMSAECDGYFHALGGYFVYDFARWWIASPTFSMKSIMSFILDYEARYKFLGGLTHYQPFQSLLVGFLAFFSGKYPFTFYISTILETLGTMLYGYKLYGLMYGERKKLFLFLVPIFIAFSPIVFNFGASFSNEPGIMLFSTMTIFYFIRYIKAEKNRDLYLTAASFGLGVLTKSPFVIILPILLLCMLAERKHRLLFRNYKALLISFAIFLVVISPFLMLEYIFIKNGISDLDNTLRIQLIIQSMNLGSSLNVKLANLSTTLWVIFGTFLLIPFLFYKLLKSRRLLGEMTLLLFIILYSFFYNLIGTVPEIQPRLFLPVIPIAVMLSIRGMQIFSEKQKRFEKYLIPAIGFILFTSILSCYNYTTLEKEDFASTDILSPAIYISDNTQTPTTVLSTFSRMQSVAFLTLGNKNIYTVEAPYTYSGGVDELEIMLDSKDYVRRPNMTEWERFNLTHPPIGWVIIHERYDGLEPDYKLKDVIDKREDFELVQVMEGKWPGNRVFIYKRKPSFYNT
jgi:4-amino-4-deoxy-L-arabinose transferase-like glycosyltransferase